MSFKTQDGQSQLQEFGSLYNRYREKLLTRMTSVVKDQAKAEDITASALSVAFERLNTFRGEASFYTWVYAIALNEARSLWREPQHTSLDVYCEQVTDGLNSSDDLEKSLARGDDELRLTLALTKIPKIYRQVLEDHFIDRHSVKKIAGRENIPVGTVLSRIFKAKQLLRKAWEDVG